MSEIVTDIPLEEILDDENFNCRGKIMPMDVVDIAKDIERQGLIQPVTVCPMKDPRFPTKKYRLLAGFRRFMAHRVLKRGTIRAMLKEFALTEIDARLINLAENLQRRDLNVVQEAKALQGLINLKITENEIAQRLGQSRGWVQIRAMLLKLPEDVQKEVQAGVISHTNIRELYMIHRTGNQEALFKMVRILKDAKLRGVRRATVHPEKYKLDKKMLRDKKEIERMTEHLVDTIGSGLYTRTLAWASGNITLDQLFTHIENYADQNGLSYTRPDPETLKAPNAVG